MNLPSSLREFREWTVVGPMGPLLPDELKAHPVLAVDGGANFTERPRVWVGDRDSLSVPLCSEHEFQHRPEKSLSDLALALTLFEEALPYKLHLWGFLGGRQDHELFNFGETSSFLARHPGSEAIFYGERDKKFFHFFGKGKWTVEHQGIFSLGAFAPVQVTITGNLKYPLTDPVLLKPLSSLGLSNEARGAFTLASEGPVFVYFPEGK